MNYEAISLKYWDIGNAEKERKRELVKVKFFKFLCI